MRRIYLVRHGLPFFPDGKRYCIGSADFELDTLGQLQGCTLGEGLKSEKLTVFTSPLKRACDTALYLSKEPVMIDGLREMHAGDWDGLSFDEIEIRWPELYRARAYDTELAIPGSENWQEGQRRFKCAVNEALRQSEGDIAIVAHTTVILSLVCHVLGDEKYRGMAYRPDYGCYYIAELDDDGKMHCTLPWIRPEAKMSEELCLKLMAAAELPAHIRAHCIAVAVRAKDIAAALAEAGLRLNTGDVYHAALLHDIARQSPDHARLGGEWLCRLGYESIGEIIKRHHDFDGDSIDEAAVLFIADKLIQGSEEVGLERRFEKSREKCIDAEAVKAHDARYKRAKALAEKINRLCKREVIK